MPAVKPGSKVLDTGANGYIALWVVRLLLEAGFLVRGTVRAHSKAAYLTNYFHNYAHNLDIVVVDDITKPGAFDEAVRGVDAIAHTASPFHMNADDPQELILPAVNGTLGVLTSALAHAPALQRVLVLSSCAAVSNPSDVGLLDEANWNTENVAEVEHKGRDASQAAKYRASKAIAERAAWEFVKEHEGEIAWDLVVLNPPFVFGPTLHDIPSLAQLNTSMHAFHTALVARPPPPAQLAAPQGAWVDVRDLARSSARAQAGRASSSPPVRPAPAFSDPRRADALTRVHAYMLSGSFTWLDWLNTAHTLPPGTLPLPLPLPLPPATPDLNPETTHPQRYSTTRARDLLGLTFRPRADTLIDSLRDFRARGWC